MKQIIKNFINNYPSYNSDDLIEKIREYDCISFDLFDTLVKRNVSSNSLIYKLAYQDYVNKNTEVCNRDYVSELCSIREQSEKKARETLKKEPTIEDIYGFFPLELEHKKNALKDTELLSEVQHCYSNIEIKKVYDWCVLNGKRIIVITDTYLRQRTIEKILRTCGYNKITKVYISCEIQKTKSKGDLFDFVLNEEKISPNKIIHIGDNLRADFIKARFKGIKSLKIARYPNNSLFWRYSNKCSSIKRLNLAMRGHFDKNWNVYYQYGYEVIGPLLYGFSKWLHSELKDKKFEKIFFLARDGYLLKNAYEAIYGTTGNKSKYLYISRQALRLPQVCNNTSTTDLLDLLPQSICFSCKDFCNFFNLDYEQIIPCWLQSGLKEDFFSTPRGYSKTPAFETFIKKIFSQVICTANQEKDNVIQYLQQIGFHSNVAVVDIGWKGSIQNSLEKIINSKPSKINCKLYGYYLGLTTNRHQTMTSFIPKEANAPEFVGPFFEYPFLAPEGSLKTYGKDDQGKIKPVLNNYEYEGEENSIVDLMQKGALFFIECIKQTKEDFSLDNYKNAYDPIKRISKKPVLKEVNLFGPLKYMDGNVRTLATPKSIFYYCLNPRKFSYDLSNSGWKIGFFIKIFKFNLGIISILKFLKKAK